MSYWKGQLFTVDSANIGHDDDALNPYNQSVAVASGQRQI